MGKKKQRPRQTPANTGRMTRSSAANTVTPPVIPPLPPEEYPPLPSRTNTVMTAIEEEAPEEAVDESNEEESRDGPWQQVGLNNAIRSPPPDPAPTTPARVIPPPSAASDMMTMLQQMMDKQTAQLHATFAPVTKRVEVLEEKVEHSVSTLTTLGNTIGTMESTLATVQKDVKNISVPTIIAEINAGPTICALQNSIADLQQDRTSINELEVTMLGYDVSLDSLTTSMSETRSKVDKLETVMGELTMPRILREVQQVLPTLIPEIDAKIFKKVIDIGEIVKEVTAATNEITQKATAEILRDKTAAQKSIADDTEAAIQSIAHDKDEAVISVRNASATNRTPPEEVIINENTTDESSHVSKCRSVDPPPESYQKEYSASHRREPRNQTSAETQRDRHDAARQVRHDHNPTQGHARSTTNTMRYNNTDRTTRAAQKGISPFRNPDTATKNSSYLGEVDGVARLDWQSVLALGFGEDHFEDLDSIHHTLLQTWSFKDVEGPKEKSLKETNQFRPLSDLHMDSLVDFYTFFQFQVLSCNIAITPFDAIVLRWKHIGLCPPGVGSRKYIPMAKALFVVLTRLLPIDDPNVSSRIGLIQHDSQDGYKLLWQILSLSLPGFSSTVIPKFPRWSNVRDVTMFAKLVTLHFRLIAKKGNYQTEKEKSLLYLRGIQEHSLQGTISSLVTAIDSHQNQEFDDEYLPENLTIAYLAQRITLDYASMQTDHDSSRRVNQAIGQYSGFHDDISDDDYGWNGLQPTCNALEQRRRTPSNQAPRATSQYQRPPGLPTPAGRRAESLPSNRAPHDPNVTCRACGRIGHPAERCFDLGKALVMGDYINNHRNTEVCKRVKEAWRLRNVRPPGDTNDTMARPRIVMAYVDLAGMSTSQLVEEFDWEFFVSDDLQRIDANE